MEQNILYCSDCLEALKKIPNESIDLIYLDPPFFSQKDYENFWIKDKVSKLKFSDKDWEKLRNSVDKNILSQYEDIEKRWKGGHKGIFVYIAYMRERLEQCWRVLKSTGSIYLHCDWHAGHYLKMMMDEVFGYNNFQNEIVWHYNTGGATNKRFSKKHDTIFFYTKSNKYSFNTKEIREPYREDKSDHFQEIDSEGRKYRIREVNGKKYKYYLDSGRVPHDVWDIDGLNAAAKERLGYPTQKPEKLLEKIIKASSNEGDIILDPFCGCGTTIAVAEKLKRKWIGIDISRTACDVISKRLGKDIRIIGGETEKELSKMEPHEFARIVIIEKLGGTINPKKSGDLGIDGWVDFMSCPVQVKRWSHQVGRPEIDKFKSSIQRNNKKKGIIVAFDFSKESKNEVERIKTIDKIDIKLKTVRDIFGLDYFGA